MKKTGLSSKIDRKNTHFRKAVKFSFLSKICEWHDLTNLQSFKFKIELLCLIIDSIHGRHAACFLLYFLDVLLL